ncbi:hypothetical protein JCM9279_006492 [Rhodotorula babjevae]
MRGPSHDLLFTPRPVRPITTVHSSTWVLAGADLLLDKLGVPSLDASASLALAHSTRPTRQPSRNDDERVFAPPALGRHERIAAHHGTTCVALVQVDEADEGAQVKADDEALLVVLARSSRRAGAAAAAGAGDGSARSKRGSFRPSLGSIHEQGAGEREMGEREREAAERMGSSAGSRSPASAASSSSERSPSAQETEPDTPASSLAPDSPPSRPRSPSRSAPAPPPTTSGAHEPAQLSATRPTPPSTASRGPSGALRALVARLTRPRAQSKRRAQPTMFASGAGRAVRQDGVWVVVEVEEIISRELGEGEERRGG